MRIFFHLAGETVTIPDTEGVEVDDLGAVRAMLAREVGELMGEFPEDDRRGWRFNTYDCAPTE